MLDTIIGGIIGLCIASPVVLTFTFLVMDYRDSRK